jgi:hypothetical protein
VTGFEDDDEDENDYDASGNETTAWPAIAAKSALRKLDTPRKP